MSVAESRRTATLLIKCPDHTGLVRDIAGFIARHGGNILHADHHIDFESQQFFSRVEWDLRDFVLPAGEISNSFEPVAQHYAMQWELRFSDEEPDAGERTDLRQCAGQLHG